MSAILKALRRLETDENGIVAVKSNIPIKAGNRRSNRTLRRYILLGGLFLMAVTTFAGSYIYFRYPQYLTARLPSFLMDYFPTESTPKVSGSLQKPAPKKPKPIRRQKKAQQLPISARDLEHPKMDTDHRIKTSSSRQNTPPKQDAALKNTEIQKAQPKSPGRESGRRTAAVSTVDRRESKPPPPAAQRAPLREKQPAPELISGDSSLKLQAIAWSNDPDQRIAVINGQILREGGTVEGITVTGIEKDAVIVREGAKTKKLVFRIK